jgi:hypothetical protein
MDTHQAARGLNRGHVWSLPIEPDTTVRACAAARMHGPSLRPYWKRPPGERSPCCRDRVRAIVLRERQISLVRTRDRAHRELRDTCVPTIDGDALPRTPSS